MGRDLRWSAKIVGSAVKILEKDPEAKRILQEDLKFGNMMMVNLDTLRRRDIIETIYNNSQWDKEGGKIVTRINGVTIDVTIERIEQILGLPRGTEEGKSVTLPTSASNQVIDLFLQHGKCKKAIPSAKKPTLKYMAIGASDLLGLMDVVDTKMKVRCFLMIVLNRLLIPSSGFHLNDRQAQIAWDLGSVEKIDWCKLVFEDLKDCIKNRRNDTDNCSGCSIVLLIAVFEALVPSKCPTTEPSVIGYDDEKLKLLLEQIRDKVGVKKERGIDVSNKAQPTEQKRSFLEFEEEIHAIMKEMADHLDDVKGMVPDEKRESIQCSLGTFKTLTKRLWPLDLWEPFYEANVLNVDNDSNGSHTMVRIGAHTITKAIFRESLKPDGWLSSFVIDAQCEIWRSQWPVNKIILTTFASKELMEPNTSTKSLDAELTEEKVKDVTQIFVPVNVSGVHWILVVMDFDKSEVQILDSMKSNTYVGAAYQVTASLELYLVTKFNIDTGFSKKRNLDLTEQTNTCDCGLHVLLYIQRYGCSDMCGIDEEQILRYRKQLAYELKHESNDHPSTSTLHIDESPIHVYSRPPAHSARYPSVSSEVTISDKNDADEGDTSDSSRMSNAQQEDTSDSSLIPNAQQVDTRRKRKRKEKTAVKTPVVPERQHTETGPLICDLVLKADPRVESMNLINMGSLEMNIKECATFLSGGSATFKMLKETIILRMKIDAKESKDAKERFRAIVTPMDMSDLDNIDSDTFKSAVKTQMAVPSIPQSCLLVFLPVKKGSDWVVYCINKLRQRIDYLICSTDEEPIDAAQLWKALSNHVDFTGRRMFDHFMDWKPERYPFEKKISSGDPGVLAMYFMEKYDGKCSMKVDDTKTWSEGYRRSLLEWLFNQRTNGPVGKKNMLLNEMKKMEN